MFKKICFLLIFILILSLFYTLSISAESDLVYKIPIEGTVNPGMVNLVQKGINEAETAAADTIIFKIDTYGGLVDSAIKIKDAIFDTQLNTITFVSNRAWSAGALIALSGSKLVMIKGSSIGAAETRPKEEKYISALRKEFKATAERRGKNSKLAAAMVDADISVEGTIAKDKLLTLTSSEAKTHNMSDLLVKDFQGLVEAFNLKSAEIVEVGLTLSEKMARIVTNPNISTFLLTLGLIALVFEAIAPGWGIGGTVGLLSLGLFFSGFIITGSTGWGLIVLFLVGLILIFLEIFVVPGFGITGTGGLTALFVSLFFMFPTPEIALRVLAAVLLFSIIGSYFLIKIFGMSRIWNNISLKESQTSETGYVAHLNKSDLVGKKGKTKTPLRPAGIAEIDQKRVNVVSQGDFIEKDEIVKVVSVSGSSIVVKKIEQGSGK